MFEILFLINLPEITCTNKNNYNRKFLWDFNFDNGVIILLRVLLFGISVV